MDINEIRSKYGLKAHQQNLMNNQQVDTSAQDKQREQERLRREKAEQRERERQTQVLEAKVKAAKDLAASKAAQELKATNDRNTKMQRVEEIAHPTPSKTTGGGGRSFGTPSKPVEPRETESKPSFKDSRLNDYKGYILRPHADFANILDEDFNQANENVKAMGKKLTVEDVTPEYDNDVDNKLNKIKESIKPGPESLMYSITEGKNERILMDMLSKESYRKMLGKSNNVDKIEKFMDENPDLFASGDYSDGTSNKFWRNTARGTTDVVLQQVQSVKSALPEIATYTGVGAALGTAFATPTLGVAAPITTTTGALLGFKYGMKTGAAKHMYQVEAGLSYNDMIKEGIPHEIAKPIAMGVGAVNGLIETVQLGRTIEHIPGLDEVIQKVKKEGLQASMDSIKKLGLTYAGDLAKNIGEELAQENVGMLGKEIAQVYNTEQDPNVYGGFKNYVEKVKTPEWRDIMLDVAVGTAESMWLLPGLSGAGGVVANSGIRTLDVAAQKSYNKKKDTLLNVQLPDLIKKAEEDILNNDEAISKYNALRISLEEASTQENVSNKDKEQINKLKEELDVTLSNIEYKAKEIDSEVEYLPANNQEIEDMFLAEDFNVDDIELYTKGINQTTIDYYKDANKYGILEVIKEKIISNEDNVIIADEILKSLPKKERSILNATTMVNEVEKMMSEIKSQATMNRFYNISMAKDVLATNISPTEEVIEQTTNTDTPQDIVEGENVVNNTLELPSDENSTESLVEPVDENEVETVENDVVEVENDTKSTDVEENTIEYKASNVVMVPRNKILSDPERYQFRYDKGNANGADSRLASVESYNEKLAGVLLLRQDEHGDLYVINGHNRKNLADKFGIEEVKAEIISYKDYTDEEARALGAMLNIGDNNATEIDVAKVLRDSSVTMEELKSYGISPKNKLTRDGMALSQLDDWLFRQVATSAFSKELGIVIGRELGNNKVAQKQVVRDLRTKEAQGKTITANIMTEMIAEAKGTAQVEFTEQSLLGTQTGTRDLSYERASLVSYVKEELKSRARVLKNVTKEKNASILKELGNKIAIDENVKEMTQAEQALWIMDKTLNYQGTKVNELFNKLSLELAEADPKDKRKIQKRALAEFIQLMEGGNLLNETINKRGERESIKRTIQENSEGTGNESESSLESGEQEVLEGQVDIFGNAVNQLKATDQVKVVYNKGTELWTKRDMKPILEAMKKNIFFNGLEVVFTGKEGKKFWTREELDNAGYTSSKEGIYTAYGSYRTLIPQLSQGSIGDNARREYQGDSSTDRNRDIGDSFKASGRIEINNGAKKDTILHEIIHFLQDRMDVIKPKTAALIRAWEKDIREEAIAKNIPILDGKELLVHALLHGEFGYAEDNDRIGDLIAVDNDIIEDIKAILGQDIVDLAFGTDKAIPSDERALKAEYEGYARRMFLGKDDNLSKDIEATIENRKVQIRKELANNRAATYHNPSSSLYVIVSPSTKGSQYQVTTISPKLGPLSDAQYNTIDEVADRLVEDKFFYMANEISYQLKQYTRKTVDELYSRNIQQLGFLTDQTNENIVITDNEVVKLMGDARIGNLLPVDFDNLILNNNNIEGITKIELVERIMDAVDKGYDVPNSEVKLNQYLNRFYGVTERNSSNIKPARNTVVYNPDTDKLDFARRDYGKQGEQELYLLLSHNTLEEAIESYKADMLFWQPATYTEIREVLKTRVKTDFSYMVEMLKSSKGISTGEANNTVIDNLYNQYLEFRDNIETYRHEGLDYNFDMKPHYAISYESKEGLLKRESFVIQGTRVVKNPNSDDLQEIYEDVEYTKPGYVKSNRAYGTTYDKQGNMYVWNILNGSQSAMDRAIGLKFNVDVDKTNINYQLKAATVDTNEVYKEEFITESGINVYRNPSPDTLDTLKGYLRTYDEQNNTYYWVADESTREEVENTIDARYGTRTEEKGDYDYKYRNEVFKTKKFKKWFKDSKVVDSQGVPLILYHGTRSAGFTEFNRVFNDNGRSGFFFTNDLNVSRSYAGENYPIEPMKLDTFEEAKRSLEEYDLYLEKVYWNFNKGLFDTLEDLYEQYPEATDIREVFELRDSSGNVIENYKTLEELKKEAGQYAAEYGSKEGVYEVYLSMQNPYIIDGDYANWDDIQGMTTNEWVKEISEAGNAYDGVIFRNISDNGGLGGYAVSDVYVAFNPTQIKSIYNNGMFNEYDPNINYQLKKSNIVNVDGFYSNLENVINDKMGKRAKASEIMNMLTKNGVKPEEMEWFEISSFLEGKDFVYKQELLDHMETKGIKMYTKDMGNQFESYTLKGGSNYKFNAYVYDNNPGKPFVYQPHFGSYQNIIGHNRYKDRVGVNGEKVLLVEELQSDWHQKGRQEGYVTQAEQGKISSITSEIDEKRAKKNNLYKESSNAQRDATTAKYAREYYHEYQDKLLPSHKKNLQDEQIELASLNEIEQPEEYANALGWVAYYEKAIVDMEADITNWKEKMDLYGDPVIALEKANILNKQYWELDKEIEALEKERNKLGKAIPDAPLKESITDFLFKQAIKDAVIGGYDSIAWTTGEQQADRYDIRQTVDKIEWRTDAGDSTDGQLVGSKNGRSIITEWMSENELSDFLGKSLANELIAQETENYGDSGYVKRLAGEQMAIGGEFHKKLYDNYVPRMIKKYGKKWGLNIGSMDIGNIQAAAIQRAGGIDDIVMRANKLSEETGNDVLAYMDNYEIVITEETEDSYTIIPFDEVLYAASVDEDGILIYDNFQEEMVTKMQSILDNATVIEQPSIEVTPAMIEDVMTNGQPLFQLKEVEGQGNLLAMHNITEGKLKSALKLDGFPMASLAVTTIDKPLSNFGEISLLFKKDTIDPKRTTNRVFGADVYSPRFPSPKYNMLEDSPVWSKFRTAEKQSGLSLYQLEADFSMGRSVHGDRLMKYTYMNEKGIELDFTSANDIWDRHRIVDDAFNSNNMYDDEYRSWADDQLEQGTKPVFWDRKANKEIPMTLDNALKLMKREEVRGGEGGQYSGALRALATREFTSIKDIKANIDLIVDTDTFEEAKADAEYMQKEAEQILQKYSNYSRMYDEVYSMLNNYFKYGSGIEAMQKGLNAIDSKMYGKMEVEDVARLVEYADWLRNMPTEYFEAKLRRKLGTNEIQAVIAPNDLSVELEQMLKDKGINLIEKYEYGDEVGRKEAIDRVLRQNDVSFQLKAADTTTNEFKKWFGDSKVVDDEGNPMAVYHGTNKVFDEFVTSNKWGYGGTYFTADNSVAESFSNNGSVYPVYLSLQNPLTVDAYNRMYDSIQRPLEMGEGGLVDTQEIVAFARNNGYDGVIVKNVIEGTRGLTDDIIAFNPSQIKSVYNYGAWDANDANIYYQLKEEPEIKERSWGQTVRDAALTEPWLTELLTSNKFFYEVKHNEDTIMAAAQLIEKKGEEYIEARLLSDLDNDAVLMAASQILTYKYMESGEQDRAMAMLEKTAAKATSLGQAIQILSVWGRQSAEGMLRSTINIFKGLMTDKDRLDILLKTKQLTEDFNNINRQAIKDIDLVGTIQDIKNMGTDERVARDIASKGGTLPEGGFTTDMLDVFENTIDEGMTQKIIDTVNQHFVDGKGNLKNKLGKLGLNDFEVEILDKFIKSKVKEATKDSKQALIDKNLSKKKYERVGIDQKILDATVDGVDESVLRNLVGEKEGMPVLTKELVDYIYKQGQYINTLEPGRKKDVETGKMIKEITDHMPVNFWSKVNTFRVMAMLLNAKTTIRNLVGNDMFRRLDTFALNFLGTPIDVAMSKASGRRTMLFRPIEAAKVQKLGYKEGWRLGLEDALLGINTSDSATQFDLNRQGRTFKSGPLSGAETLMNIALRATDRAAMMATFMDSLEEQMQIANVDVATEEMTSRAMQLALYRTFQDTTVLSEMFSGLKKNMNRVGFGLDPGGKWTDSKKFGAGDLFMPFPKTPANIMGRAIDYSPVGLVMTMFKLSAQSDSYMKQRMVVEGLSRAIMGTGMIAIGAVLAKMGIFTGSNPDDDNEDIYKLKKAHGLRDFSVNLSAIGRHFLSGFTDPRAGELKKGDIIASYDWAQPMSMALAIGADTELGGTDAKDILSTVVRAWETGVTTLTDQPVLTGVANLFRYGDPAEGFSQAMMDLPSSFTPTLFSHIAQFIDGRDTDPYTFYEGGRKVASKIMNKVPGLRGNIPSRYTALGTEKRYYPEDNNLIVRALNTFLNPAITGKYMPTDEAEFIFDLYESSGDPDIVPKAPQKKYTIDKVVYTFTPESWEQMSKWLGNRYKNEIGYVMNTRWSAEEQADEIKFIIKEVKDEAKEKAVELGTKVE